MKSRLKAVIENIRNIKDYDLNRFDKLISYIYGTYNWALISIISIKFGEGKTGDNPDDADKIKEGMNEWEERYAR